MHFDDRLATVIRQRPASDVIARVQFRQLVDLLGSLPVEADSMIVRAAYDRLWSLNARIATRERVQMLLERGLRLRNPRLIAMLAQSEPAVASAAITSAHLSEEEWLDLIPALPVRTRGILRYRRDLGERVDLRLAQLGITDRGLPPAELNDQAAAEQHAPTSQADLQPPSPDETTGIGAIVRRIEEFRKAKEPVAALVPQPANPRLPFDDAGDTAESRRCESFDFTTDAEGRIDWADQRVAPMVAGVRLGLKSEDSAISGGDRLAAAIHRRQPISGERVSISGAPAVAGAWRIDAVPRFDSYSGRFTGYVGRARALPELAAEPELVSGAADRMRQILHELRTPVGAIQMSAEVIQQQLYGPTPHEYRALAASIASDTARILAGFEEMERLAKLETGALDVERGTSEMSEAVSEAVERLKAHTDLRKSGFAMSLPDGPALVGLDRVELDRLAWRLLAGLAGAAAPAEMLSIHCTVQGGKVETVVTLPDALSNLGEEALFHARADEANQSLSAGMFGLGFTLRLARAEARAAGGSLVARDGTLVLELPGPENSSVNISLS